MNIANTVPTSSIICSGKQYIPKTLYNTTDEILDYCCIYENNYSPVLKEPV